MLVFWLCEGLRNSRVFRVSGLQSEHAQQPLAMQRLDQGRTAVAHKLGGNNLSDGCYVELLLRGLGNKERGELIKAQVLRQSRDG